MARRAYFSKGRRRFPGYEVPVDLISAAPRYGENGTHERQLRQERECQESDACGDYSTEVRQIFNPYTSQIVRGRGKANRIAEYKEGV